MDSKSKEAYELQMTLADKGSLFSTSEIKEILEVLRGVSLKLIITNVPSEVFLYNAAQVFRQSIKLCVPTKFPKGSSETFELHPRDQVNQHPSIVITPCENDPTYEKNMKKVRIVQTKCPERNY
ncbi:Protein sarah [Schistosoma japonicum]|nr:Protein sarah [Schistosoma japonicum]